MDITWFLPALGIQNNDVRYSA